MLINAGVKRIIYDGDYPGDLAKKILQESKIEVKKYKKGNIN